MNNPVRVSLAVIACASALVNAGVGADQSAAPLPPGAKVVWDLDKAYREATPTRERICINGLWHWQPGDAKAEQTPAGNWGYFKVPGCWPGITDFFQQYDCQILYPHPSWKATKLADVTTAWYQREITVPAAWAGRRISLATGYVNSYAVVYVDGNRAGDIRFPGGDVDLTSVCRPGTKQVLSMLVTAMPLRAVIMSFSDTNAAKQVKGTVPRRGLCGDVWLVGEPLAARIGDIRIDTSVRNGQITVNARLEELAADAQYTLHAQVADKGGKAVEFTSGPIRAGDLKDGRAVFSEKWKPAKLWDIITPENQYDAAISLLDAQGKVLDTSLPVRFGFREFWIDGRDFYLNGTRIFLSCVPLENGAMGVGAASYEAAKETLLRLKTIGINFVYTHNYGCEPGTHLGFTEILRAADDVGMLVAFSQPHFGQYNWQKPDADQANGYARDAAFYVAAAGSHPSVVFYSMSHNATGYVEALNPDRTDGIQDTRDPNTNPTVKHALQAAAIVNRMDPTRVIYHHESGNLGSMYTTNFYTNFAPIQEMDDWFEHWSTKGVKPNFTCEYMVPCTWDWTMYRGWYNGSREYGSASVPWEYCVAEWSSQFLGDRAYQISEAEKQNLRWEAEQFRAGKLWKRWDYPFEPGSKVFDDQHAILGIYTTSNWRAFRTWEMSANSPWDFGFSWKLRDGVDRSRKNLTTAWENLQRPGYSPDYVGEQFERMDTAHQRSDWLPTADGQALLRNNMPLLAYIGGKPAAFTSKDHNFLPGETVEKQLIVINNSRQTVTADCRWSLGLPQAATGIQTVTIATGQQKRVPLRLTLPTTVTPGKYELSATVSFSKGETQQDTFTINVMPRPESLKAVAKIAVFDPKGETTKLLAGMGIRAQPIEANVDLAGYDIVVVGKGALTVDDPGPDVRRVRDGLKVLMFEQTSETLERRFGFRVAEYGLRQVFKRVPDHALLAGLEQETLRDWRGDATLLPPRLKYFTSRTYGGPAIKWCDLEVPQVWRCGNRGNVASVLIEKPARGNFLPIVDGGYSLQYSPLMEYREGKGVVLFCQMDVTGRTETDPAAEMLVRNLFAYTSAWKPAVSRTAVYVGDAVARRHLDLSGIPVVSYEGGKLSPDKVLVVAPGGGQELAANAAAVADFVRAGGNLLALGLDEGEANAFLPTKVSMKKAEHIAAFFEPFGAGSILAGVSPADVHNRAPRMLPLVTGGAGAVGNGVLAKTDHANVVFCQFPPHLVTRAEGVRPSFVIAGRDAVDGEQSALLALGTTTAQGVQFGQNIKAGEVGKTYTFAVFAKSLRAPASAHLEIERPASPWDRVVKGDNVPLKENEWTELHVTFKVEKPYPEGWFAYLASAHDGAWLRVDLFRIYEGDYVPWRATAAGAAATPAAGGPAFTDGSFETKQGKWRFTFSEQYNLRRTYRRSSFQLARLLANMGVAARTPLLARFGNPATAADPKKRWLDGFYLDQPEEWDYPYRFFCW